MNKLVNKIILLSIATALLTIGCSKPSNNGLSNNELSKDKYSSDKEYSFVDTLKINNLNEEDKVIKYSGANIYSYHGEIINKQEQSQNTFTLTNKEESLAFKSKLKNDEILNDLDSLDLVNNNLVITNRLTCTSGAFSYVFKDLYLKNNTLYIHMYYDDRVPDGMGVDMSMKYQYLRFLIDKTVSYTDTRIINDHYE